MSSILTEAVRADLTFSSITLTTTTFSVNVSGTMPAAAPGTLSEGLFFVNPDTTENPGYVIPTNSVASTSRSFTGTQTLDVLSTGAVSFGDYSFATFTSPLTPGQAVNGTISGTWASAVFDASQVTGLSVYWGSSNGTTLTTGVLVGNNVPVVGVPEGSTALLAAMAGIVMLRRRRR